MVGQLSQQIRRVLLDSSRNAATALRVDATVSVTAVKVVVLVLYVVAFVMQLAGAILVVQDVLTSRNGDVPTAN